MRPRTPLTGARSLGYGEPQQGERVVGPADQAVLDGVELPLEVVPEVADGDAVGAAAATVVPQALEGAAEGGAGEEALEDLVGHAPCG